MVWAASPPVLFFKPRDFCTVVHYRKLKVSEHLHTLIFWSSLCDFFTNSCGDGDGGWQDGTVEVVNRKAEHPDAPETDKYVRGKILMGANIIQPLPGQPNRCRFTMVTQVRSHSNDLITTNSYL